MTGMTRRSSNSNSNANVVHNNNDPDNHVVELVLRENRSLGVKIQKVHAGRVIKLLRLEEDGQAEAAAKEMELDPDAFVDARIIGVDGQRYSHGAEVYTALRLVNRPKRILVQLQDESHDTFAPLPGSNDNGGGMMPPQRRASLLKQKATFATASMRQLSESMDEMEKMNAELEAKKKQAAPVEASPSVRARKILGFLREGASKTTRFGFSSPRVGRRGSNSNGKSSNFMPLNGNEGPKTTDDFLPLSERAEFQYLDDETQRDILKKEARDACLAAIRDHFEAFIEENPNVSYEEWIEELHPENAKSKRNLVHGHSIDHRLYTEHSDHRRIWNSKLGDGAREYVPVRSYNATKSIRAAISRGGGGGGCDDEPSSIHAEPQVKKSFVRSPPQAAAATSSA
eukprot:CAMPEP_0194033192 /NCGR_PEP_ID=MMETSP0009_2-20130614/5968_1 /TAXON_ID=210454 /ORGANISM="Grammatophora oceanica, Strain CCMP 410" /LENGTH=398 /DNA_ID=CAMNT_0038673835 /DNA_START=272 /DNA_END=1468 /DNA_ORIENTATION=-